MFNIFIRIITKPSKTFVWQSLWVFHILAQPRLFRKDVALIPILITSYSTGEKCYPVDMNSYIHEYKLDAYIWRN